MKYDPYAPRRISLGDGRALHAAYILDAMQPYPGDPWWIVSEGIQPRFIVFRRNKEEYTIYDEFTGFGTYIPQKLLDNFYF
ncbi:hypothetical protein M413DRAFT_55927, partial [Hebeloma cylindrosporum]